jgi:hypothetical protein
MSDEETQEASFSTVPTPEELVDSNTKAELQDAAAEADVEVSSSDTKADIAEKLVDAGVTQEAAVGDSEWARANSRAAEEEARQVQTNANVADARDEVREEFNNSEQGAVAASNTEAERVARMPSPEAHEYLVQRTQDDPDRGPHDGWND